MPPKAFQLRLRLDRAKELLALTDDGIETIAETVGFADSFYFSRLFHAREGLAPSAFRARNQRT
jgi:transcriptional regulator GlxA family with amidase domain